MKNILYLFFLLSFSIVFSQEKIYKATYGVIHKIDNTSELEKMFKQSFKNYETISDEFEFILIFDNEKSFFQKKKKIYSDKNAAELVSTRIGYYGRIKQTSDAFITENLDEEFGKFLVERKNSTWIITNETKQVGDFLCFKATTDNYEFENSINKNPSNTVTAWFTPEIPHKYGPIGYGNLKGLIIQLETKSAIFQLKKLEYDDISKNEIKFPKLKKLKKISAIELEKLALEYESQRN